MGNLFLAMEIDYGMSSFIAKNKLPTLKPNSYLHTQASEIQVTTKWSKHLHISCSELIQQCLSFQYQIMRLAILAGSTLHAIYIFCK